MSWQINSHLKTAVCKTLAMGALKRIAPIFAVRDLDVAMAH
jgi:hypothetical protein